MKSAYRKPAVRIIPFIALALLVSVALGLSGRAERVRTAALSQQQPGPELPGHSYGDLMNSLFAAGGR